MNDLIKSVLPTIASALGGPLAGVAVSFLSDKLGLAKADKETVTNILSGMTGDQLLQLKQHDSDLQVKLAELGFHNVEAIEEFNVRALESVNKTMQAEAASEHWPTYSWRPFIGFMFGSYIGSMWLLPLFGKTPTTISADLTVAVGAILGVASYFRGKMQADPTIPTINKG